MSTAVRLRNPSLEFNWLPNSMCKGLSTPRVFVLDDNRWGGFYVHQTLKRFVFPSLDIDLSEGAAIVLCATPSAGSIAHEYRHHWQRESGYKLGNSVWSQKPGESYAASIRRYFRTFWWEREALRFQNRVAPDHWSLQWAEWLREPVRAAP